MDLNAPASLASELSRVGCFPDDRIVNHHEPLARNDFPQRVELQANAELPQCLGVGEMKVLPT